MRLSRHSGIAGLAGMPYTSKLFLFSPDYAGNDVIQSILLVRPLLNLTKNDLYEVCRRHNQTWVEDPTNSKLIFVRNVIRSFLNKAEFCFLKEELRSVMVLCQEMRVCMDRGRDHVLEEAVLINQDFGYAVIELGKLNLAEGSKHFLRRALVAILQFVAQKDKPPRSRVVETLVQYLSSNQKGALTLAGCNICMEPRSRNSRVLICASCDSKMPAGAVVVNPVWACDQIHIGSIVHGRTREASQPDHESLDAGTFEFRNMHERFMSMENTALFLVEAARVALLSDLSFGALMKLLDELRPHLNREGTTPSPPDAENPPIGGGNNSTDLLIPCDHACYFMNRFWIAWGLKSQDTKDYGKALPNPFSKPGESCGILSAVEDSSRALRVRYMKEKDWVFLIRCAEEQISCASSCREGLCEDVGYPWFPQTVVKYGSHGSQCCLMSLAKKAHSVLANLKKTPLPVRRALPVLVTAQGALIGVPSLGLSLCPNIWVSSRFCPRIPLGGGPASWL